MGFFSALAVSAALLTSQAAPGSDPDNPTCPVNPNWSSYAKMRFTVEEVDGRQVLLAEGRVDDDLIPRLEQAIADFRGDEIWLRSPGGNAKIGNQAGRIIRDNNLQTRIPEGWACYSACNFLFMGGIARFVDPGGHFIVHMFTHTEDRDTIRSEVARGEESTIGLIGEIEQQSALLASEDNDFLIRMGLSRRLLTEVMYQTSAVAAPGNRETRRCLTKEELRDYNVVNG